MFHAGRALFLLSVFTAAALAGCVADDEDPAPRLSLTGPATVAMNEVAEFWVRFNNTAGRMLQVNATDGCGEPVVRVEVDGVSLPLEAKGSSACTANGGGLRPGAAHVWGPFLFRPDTFRQGGAALFAPGDEVRLVVDLAGAATSWPVGNASMVRITAAVAELTVDVVPARRTFEAGETIAVRVWLNNTRDEPFRYTSSDTCNDIHVWAVGAGADGERARLYRDMEPLVCGQALTDFSIPPGGGLDQTVHWDGSRSGTGGAPYVPRGSYTLEARLDGKEGLPGGRADVFVVADG